LSVCCRVLQAGAMSRGVAVAGVLILVAGCHGGRQNDGTTLLGRISNAGHARTVAGPGELAEKGRAEIVTECEKQSYETARKGLIVSETRLHEDVFALRDRVSYAGLSYRLDEALRLEALLQAEAGVAGHLHEQARCIEEFAAHFETLSDPLVEADERQKELDASAFRDSTKEADAQADKKLREAERVVEPEAQEPELLPKDY
jgi:hypothetical protein